MPELGDLLTSQPQQTEAAGTLELRIRQEIKLFLKLLQTEVLRNRHLSSTYHLKRQNESYLHHKRI